MFIENDRAFARSMLSGMTMEGNSVPFAVVKLWNCASTGENFGAFGRDEELSFALSLSDEESDSPLRDMRSDSAFSARLAARGWKNKPVGRPSGLCMMIPWLALEPSSLADFEKYSIASGEAGEGGFDTCPGTGGVRGPETCETAADRLCSFRCLDSSTAAAASNSFWFEGAGLGLLPVKKYWAPGEEGDVAIGTK